MTEQEINQLRRRLAREVERYAEGEDYITDAWVKIGETNALALTSEAEMLVFGIAPEQVAALQTAYMGYLVLEDIIAPSPFDERTTELIEKARDIVPPLKSFGRDIPFATGMMDERFFAWFAREFFGISHRQAYAIYAKHDFNVHAIAVFSDEANDEGYLPEKEANNGI